MTARATWNGEVLAESEETIIVEGNHYFPPASVKRDLLPATPTRTRTVRGRATRATTRSSAGGETNDDAAWYYPAPFDAAEPIRDYVAFWKGVEVSAEPGDGTPGPEPPPR